MQSEPDPEWLCRKDVWRGLAAVGSYGLIYELLTLQPGAAREYSRQEFARDLYLLDQSGVATVRSGATVSFHAARGNEASTNSSFLTVSSKTGNYQSTQIISPISSQGSSYES